MKKVVIILISIFLVQLKMFSQNFAVEFKSKFQISNNYDIKSNKKIKQIAINHKDISIKQSYPDAKNLKLLNFFTIKGVGDKKKIIDEYLSTGLFDSHVIDFDTAYSLICQNPVQINDSIYIQNYLNGNNYPLIMIDAPCAWSLTQGSPDILIGIADTEFDSTHEDLKNKFAYINGAISGGNWHGTAVASIAAAETANSKGMASIGYNSKLAAQRVIHSSINGQAYTFSNDIRDAIWSLYQNGVSIINVSWTSTGLDYQAAEEITQNGTTLILGGGNTPTSNCHETIANIPGVIVVSSVNEDNMHEPTQHAHNQWIDICAPGSNILFAKDGAYYSGTGTSAATPFVSGTIALMLSVNSNLSPENIEELLKQSADTIADQENYTGLLGAGRLNAYNAVRLALCPIPEVNILSQIVSVDTTVNSCGNINIQDVMVTSNSKLTINAAETVNINYLFEVELGSTLDIQ